MTTIVVKLPDENIKSAGKCLRSESIEITSRLAGDTNLTLSFYCNVKAPIIKRRPNLAYPIGITITIKIYYGYISSSLIQL